MLTTKPSKWRSLLAVAMDRQPPCSLIKRPRTGPGDAFGSTPPNTPVAEDKPPATRPAVGPSGCARDTYTVSVPAGSHPRDASCGGLLPPMRPTAITGAIDGRGLSGYWGPPPRPTPYSHNRARPPVPLCKH